MPAPVIVPCTADAWTKVATSVIAARVWFLELAPSYLHTYVATGGAAPGAGDLSKAVLAPQGNRDDGQANLEVDYAELSDLYIYARGAAGSVRVDAGAGGGGFDAAIAASVASIDGKHGATGDPADVAGTRAAQLRYIGENLGSLRTMIQAAEDATEWTAVSDAANLADDTLHITGSVSVEWDKNGGTNTNSGIDDTLAAALDLSAYGASDYLIAAVYIPSLTDVDSLHIMIGTDNANYTEWIWSDLDLSVGWNFVLARLDSYVSIAGTGMQQAAVSYVQVMVQFDLAGDLLDDMKVDHVAMVTAESLKAVGTGAIDGVTSRSTIATDDPQFGELGDPADVDGHIHGQLRFIGEEIVTATMPTEGTVHDVDFDASVASGSAIAAGPVELVATEDCYYVFGAAPVAVVGTPSQFLPAGVVKQITAPNEKIAAIKVNVAGKLQITEVS